MKKIQNNSGWFQIYLYRDKQYDFEPKEIKLVPDDFEEVILNGLKRLKVIGYPVKKVINNEGKVKEIPDPRDKSKKEKPKEKSKSSTDLYSKEELEKLGFTELRELGYKQDPEVRGRSKDELVRELLNTGVKK